MSASTAPTTVFTNRTRTDHTPASHSEGIWSFLDRSARPYFAAVRDLLEVWMTHVPPPHRKSLISDLRDEQNRKKFGSAFWELYLHELYLCSGYQVTIHPTLPGTRKHPDFLIDGHGGRFYVEAVQVGTTPADAGEARRLDLAHDTIDALATRDFAVSMHDEIVGPRPLDTKQVKRELVEWLATLDADDVAARLISAQAQGRAGSYRLPSRMWKLDGWRLHFEAWPIRPGLLPSGIGMVPMSGPYAAETVDKHTGLMRALNSKANRYGKPDLPLVLAVLDNSGPPTANGYNIEQALYGLSASRPAQSASNLDGMHTEGHWLTRTGWRRGHAPQTISAINFMPWNVTDDRPWLWETLEPGCASTPHPNFLARVDLTPPDPRPLPAGPNPFGLPPGWPGLGSPAFD